MRSSPLKYALIVFLAGASYGIMATTVKFAYREGFAWTQVAASQACFGAFIFAAVLIVRRLFGARLQRLGLKQVLKLLGLGMTTCTTCLLYSFSLTMLPVSVAITLLFQFTWIGMVIQIATTRRAPKPAEIAALLVIIGGTFLASGVFEADLNPNLDPLGIVCGLLSAVSCAAFVYLSGRVETAVAPIQRGLVVCCGASLLALIACPDYFVSGALQAGIWKYGLVLGFFGLFAPVILFGIGTPHLPAGVSTIMASSELPAAILISVFVLQEAISALQGIGVVVILAGVVISQLPNLLRRADRPPRNSVAQ
ncbi:EamA family transporter [Raoultibacter phocaeensis]|uniref:EamA family transporter n=1 Tax=Raoultibacter phocaeensis TaxID=2479841 RepID=UPI001117B86A|nr:DMT family transporter [Raoultibacter phocaeensis]